MKKIITIIGLAAGLTLGAQAQETQFILSNGVIPAGSSNSAVVYCQKGTKFSIQTDTKLTGAGTAGVACVLEASNDYLQWSSTPHQFWRAANGSTSVSHLTNFDIGGALFVRITVHNSNSVAITNSTITGLVRAKYR